VKLPMTLTSIQSKLILRGWYHKEYGIRDHLVDDPMNEIPSLAFNVHDDLEPVSPRYESMARYVANQILKHTGMDYKSFTSLPRDQVEKWHEICEKFNKTESDGIDAIQAEQERATRAAEAAQARR